MIQEHLADWFVAVERSLDAAAPESHDDADAARPRNASPSSNVSWRGIVSQNVAVSWSSNESRSSNEPRSSNAPRSDNRPLLAVAFSLLLLVSTVAVPASAGLASSDGGLPPESAPSSAIAGSTPATGPSATVLDHANETPEVPTIDGATPRDLDGDERYEDVTGDGSFGQEDIAVFFRNQHREAMKRPKLFDFSGNGRVSHGDVVTLSDAVALGSDAAIEPRAPSDADDDGLPDEFEATAAGTDPHDADSDSSHTTANESGDGALDGREDLSGNGLPLAYAAELGLDPLANDTDADGLPDVVEVRYDDVDPTEADSDGDGTDDGAADLDGDELASATEAEHGTDLTRADTDGDGVDDATEVEAGLDPLSPDSDGDGLPDGYERDVGADPTTTDSDDDGTQDGNETYSVTHEHPATGVTATAVGTGTTPTELRISSIPYFDDVTAVAGPTVHLQDADPQQTVTATLPLSGDHRTEDIAAFTRDTQPNGTWERRNATLDAKADVATLDVDRDQYVTLLNATAWRTSHTVPAEEGRSIGEFDVTCEAGCTLENGSLVVGPGALEEMSSTESDADAGDGDLAVSAQSINPCAGEWRQHLPECSSDGTDDTPDDDTDGDGSSGDDESTDDGDSADGSTDDGRSGDDGGSTDGDGTSDDTDSTTGSDDTTDEPTDWDGDGVPDADDECPMRSGDGDNGCPYDGAASATVSIPVESGTVLLTTTYATEIDSAGLNVELTVGNETSERTVDIPPSPGAYDAVHVDVSEFAGDDVDVSIRASGTTVTMSTVRPFRDSDDDGLVDTLERRANGHPVTDSPMRTDPNDPDSDGDGIEDGEEVDVAFNGTVWGVASWPSDPTLTDSDGDDLPDGVERELGTDPLSTDTDADGLDDYLEVQLGTDPLEEDTDGDGTQDGYDSTPLTDSDGESGSSLAEKSGEAAKAMEEGAVRGEAGLPDGLHPSEYHDSPYYLVGWFTGSVLPGADVFADGRDAAQNAAQGDWLEAGIDAAGVVPVVGDSVKGAKIVDTWLSVNPAKATEAYYAFASSGILSKIPRKQIDDVYRKFGKWGDLKRLADTTKGKAPKAVEADLRKFTKKFNADDGAKLRSRLTYKDIERVSYDRAGDPTILVNTNKWKKGSKRKVLVDGPGWKHIVARHVSTKSEHSTEFSQAGKGDTFAVKAGEKATVKEGTTMWDESLSPEQVKGAIMEASRKGMNQYPESHGLKRIEWNVPRNQQSTLGARKITVVKVADDGKLITSFPSGTLSREADASDVPP